MTNYRSAVAVTPSDTIAIPPTTGLYVGVTGNVKVMMAGAGNTVVTFTAVPAGVILPIAVKQVFAAGTTATTMLALR